MRWVAAARTDRGRKRSSNEDAFSLRADLGFFALADGMGGHAAGEVASQMAVDRVTEEFLAAGSDALAADALESALVAATHRANAAIFERGERELDKAGMGTTLTTLGLVPAERAYRVAQVGDSRAYRLRADTLVQLTTDHTWVQQQVQLGRLSPGLARRHPFANIVTRALGIRDEIDVDIVRGELQPGDVFLLCSDGLTGMVDDAEIGEILASSAAPEAAATALVDAANVAGGQDNITAIVVSILGDRALKDVS